MGALAQPKPQVQLDKYGRDPQSPAEKLRRRTKYAKGDGWSKLFHAMVADLARLSRGASCSHLILAINAHQDNTNHDGWTPALSLDDWANLAACDAKEVQRNRDYLKSRKMAECKVDTKRLYSFRLKPELWEALEDYKTWQAKQVKVEAEDEPAADDPAQNDESKPGNWRMSKPVTVKAGSTSRVFKPDAGVAGFRIEMKNVDAGMFAVVQGGTLTVRIEGVVAAGVQKAKSEAVNRVSKSPEDVDVLRNGKDKAKPEKRTLGESHPRAGELMRLFDPLLGAAAARLLAIDSVSLLAACESLGDCDHDHLVKFTMDRAGRSPIKSPSHVKLICADALTSWKASKVLDGTRLSKAEIDRMVAEEDAALARKRAERAKRRNQ